ncbi:hypothetical protein CKA32_000580 [Geitlerinema sp. FC II]|uniref:DUF3288 family protein n=1 Tax=Baaleninema simplex TaxID=2862350 RepID=UPI000348BDC5|nr:DUF3288 family protein [Baaleninema simplex]MDC0835266.1 DUF3288 family protein [Geitlerinema sp. CS-897]PPT08636.1 hypothetical protein CKA32_000580 [Geitlerinema sp. FC II]
MSDQQHPQAKTDRATVNALLTSEPNNYNFAELARLRVRYNGFPGARDIQADLDRILKQWNLDEEALFEQTRLLHASSRVFKVGSHKKDEEDWS